MLGIIGRTLTQIIASYSQYAGTGMYMCLYFVSLLYIYITEKRRETKVLLCYYPLLTLAVILNPLIALSITMFIEKEVYWRMFWTLSITIVIAYAATSTVLHISKKIRKVVVVFALTTILIIGGKFIFTSENYNKPTNWYKLPEQTIEVCNIIENDSDGEIRVVVPADLEVSLRQYDANIQMVYGRNQTANVVDSNYGARVALGALMQENILNVASITGYLSYFQCNYLVIHKTTLLSEGLENYGYTCIASTDSYNIYRIDFGEMNANV